MHLAAGLCPDRWGSYSAPPDPLAVIGERREGHAEEGEGKGEGGAKPPKHPHKLHLCMDYGVKT